MWPVSTPMFAQQQRQHARNAAAEAMACEYQVVPCTHRVRTAEEPPQHVVLLEGVEEVERSVQGARMRQPRAIFAAVDSRWKRHRQCECVRGAVLDAERPTHAHHNLSTQFIDNHAVRQHADLVLPRSPHNREPRSLGRLGF
eukprot:2516911-Pleurochrysis_carterae.AAC.2